MEKHFAFKGTVNKNELKDLLIMLGGNPCGYDIHPDYYYYIDFSFNIVGVTNLSENIKWTVYTIESFNKAYPYKTGDKVMYNGTECEIMDMIWDSDREDITYNIKGKNNLDDYYVKVFEINPIDTYIIDIPCGFEFNNVDSDNKKIILKRKNYVFPNTYKSCVERLMGKTDFLCYDLYPVKLSYSSKYDNSISYDAPYLDEIKSFYKVLICRDAYWKTYDNWKPKSDLNDECLYAIKNVNGVIKFIETTSMNDSVLFFPTREMRLKFNDCFNDIINNCKLFL